MCPDRCVHPLIRLYRTQTPRRGRPLRRPARIDTIADVHAALAGWMHRVCADLAGCYEIPIWCSVRLCLFVALRGHVGRPSPMVTTGLCRIDFLVLTIVNGARPGSRRLIPDLQPPMAERTGSRHARSSFHPSSRLARSSFHCGWTVHNPLCRGGPLCPPARIGTKMGFVGTYAALAGWMYRVCADLAGCYENPVRYPVRLH